MNSETLAVGDPVQARCPKCRKITGHTVVAMAGEQPETLLCGICGRSAAAPKAGICRPADPKRSERDAWAALRPGLDSARATDYCMTGVYKAKALVNHPVFGLGQVQRLSGLQKMVVLFADGEKIMRCK